MSLAFKEWHAIVGALVAGRQSIILRKGGIAEGKGGFQVSTKKFWLLPTRFHAQADKLKPAATPFLPRLDEPEQLTAYAELIHHRFIGEWSDVAALDPTHLWTESTLRERFEWSRPPGLHLLEVRVFRLLEPIQLALTSAQAGCKSWVNLPQDIAKVAATQVVAGPKAQPHPNIPNHLDFTKGNQGKEEMHK